MNRISRDLGVAVLVMFGAACSSKPDVDKVPDGQTVAVTKADGGVVQGTVTGHDEKNVTVKTGRTTRSIPKAQIADVKVVDTPKDASVPPPPVPKESLPPVAKFREYTVPEGTKLSVKLTTAVSSATSKVEDAVEGTLVDPISVDGAEVFPAGSTVKGAISAAQGSGRVSGLASLTIKFTKIVVPDRADTDIDATYSETAQATKGSDAKKIGVGAAAGAVLGGLLGGKGGAAKGAVIGGGAGTGVVLATKGKEVEYAAGAVLSVELAQAVTAQIPIK